VCAKLAEPVGMEMVLPMNGLNGNRRATEPSGLGRVSSGS